jgi:hypothetical protein
MREHAGNAAKPLVGLFLLLLVFFVLLTAGAPPDPNRSRAVTESLAAAFPVGPTWLSGEDGTSGAGGDRSAAAPQQRLSHIFKTELAVARIQIREHGDVMQAEFPVTALFDGDAVRPAMRPLLQRIGAELGAVRPAIQPTVDIFFHDGSMIAPDPAMPARGSAVARMLSDHGAPARAVRVGVERGNPALLRLEFTFRRREAESQPFRGG